MHFDFSRLEILTRGGLLDRMLESAFEAAIIIDDRGYVCHCTDGACRLTKVSRENIVGSHIHSVDPVSPVDTVLSTGQHRAGVVVNIGGHECVTNLFPVITDGEVIGIIGMVLFSDIKKLQSIVSTIPEIKSDSAYDKLSRINIKYTFDDYVGRTAIVKSMLAQCRKAAKTNYPILIMGETGTGKELIASGFHAEHSQGLTPFVKINCTAIPADLLESELFGYEKGAFTGAVTSKRGKFELAESGTVLLDEIGDMPVALQGKLLRVLEDKEYERIGGTKLLPFHARIIASTNKNLREMTQDGQFREDLYYRLSTVEIFVPSLKERSQDIPFLIEQICQQEQLPLMFSEEALSILCRYHWPGNVRELKNILYRLTINAGEGDVTSRDVIHVAPYIMPLDNHTEKNTHQTEEQVKITLAQLALERDKQKVIDALTACDFNVAKAAKHLNVCRATLYNKINRYELTWSKNID